MQHALKHVERPGGSHMALDGKKSIAFHPLTSPFLCFCVFSVLLLIGGHYPLTHKMSSCMSFPLLVAIPLLCVLFGLFWLWLCVFCLFVCFFFGLVCFWWDCSLDFVLVHYQRFWGYRRIDGLACKFTIHLFCCGWTWRRWTEKKSTCCCKLGLID